MYTESIGSNNVPAFLSKLWRLVDSSQNNDLISWSPNGKSFIIRNQAKFAKELLPLYFKHNNMASFIRQLNMYGFRKITHIENTGLKVENDEIEFYHSCFVKGQESMLEYIKRKNSLSVASTKSNGALEDKTNKEEVHLILTDVKGIKNKQDNMDNMLVSLQNENEALWKEIANLRHKHQKQQQIVERLIHFLMSLVQTGNIGLKRKAPLMIDGNKNGNKDNPSLSDMANNLLNSNSGPIIQEITHGLLDDDDYENNLDSPIINTAHSDTSESAPQLEEVSDSPIFMNNQQQMIENVDLSENGTGQLASSNADNQFDPLQESINAINDEDDQIIDLNAVGAVQINSPQNINSTSNQVQNLNNNNYQQQISDQQQHQMFSTSSSANQVTNNGSPNLKLAIPSTTAAGSPYANSTQVPSASSVLNTPGITADTFDNHLEGIDTELNTLHEQLLLGNFNIDSNTLMGLFSHEEPQKSIQSNHHQSNHNVTPTSSSSLINSLNTPLSTPKQIIQQHPVPEPVNDSCNLNNNFDLCDIVNNSGVDNYPTAADNLFDNQTGLLDDDLVMGKQDLNLPTFGSVDNTPIFDADDLLSGGDADLNQLLNTPNSRVGADEQDLYFKEKKRQRIS